MWRRISGPTFIAVLALCAAVIGHNVVFLLTFGSDFGAALVRTGHGSRWDDTVHVVLAATALLALVASLRLAYLYRLVQRSRSHATFGGMSRFSYVSTVLRLWVRLYALATLIFVIQENNEQWSSGLGLPGLRVLASSGGVSPVVVFAVVSFLVAVVAALFRWGITELEARLAAAADVQPPPRLQPARLSTDPERPVTSILGRNLAGRAPPLPLPA